MSALMEREINVQDLDDSLPIEQELTWGKSFRDTREETQTSSIEPKHSPICVPFDLSTASHGHHKKKKKAAKPQRKTKSMAHLSLLERNVLSQNKYTELLAVPNKNYIKKAQSEKSVIKTKPRSCVRCYEPCSPRITQMAVPNKRLVLENWKAYQHSLPPEILMRFDEILKSGGNLEPGEARHYFKQLKRKRRKESRKRRRLLKKKKDRKKRGDMSWLKTEIDNTVEIISFYLSEKPLIMLNFQQMMTSNELLTYLCEQKIVEISSRNCKSVFKKTLIEISDKLVKWMDSLSFFAEIQPIDSKEVLKVPSMEELLEEESEEGEEGEAQWDEAGEDLEEGGGYGYRFGEDEGGGGYYRPFHDLAEGGGGYYPPYHREMGEGGGGGYYPPYHGDLGEGGGYGYPYDQDEGGGGGIPAKGREQFMAKKIVDKSPLFDQVGEGSLLDMLQDMDDSALEKLIQILSMSPDGFLEEQLDPSLYPGVTHGDVLQKLKEIRDNNLKEKKKGNVFENVMTEWAKSNDPKSVDNKVLNKIHETSTILAEVFKNESMRKSKGDDDATMVVEEIFGKSAKSNLQSARPPIIKEGNEFDGDAGGGYWYEAEGGGGGRYWHDEEDGGGGAFWSGGYGTGEDAYDEWLDAGGGGPAVQKKKVQEKEAKAKDRIKGEKEKEGVEGKEGAEGEEGIEGEKGKEGEEGKEIEPVITEEEADKIGKKVEDELEKIDALMGVILGHKPSVVLEHQPGTICCLSLKTWAAWLLEIANHTHNWTRWIAGLIRQVRYYCAVIRGDDKDKKTLPKAEWREFVRDTQEKVALWKEYSQHVKNLSDDIIKNFHSKPVTCCPKCLQDHLIKNVVTAHETLQALTEAINCAEYWHKCLDKMVETTSKITELDAFGGTQPEVTSLASEESYTIVIEELPSPRPYPIASEDSWEIQIEELQIEHEAPSEYDFIEIRPIRMNPEPQELEELEVPAPPMPLPMGDHGHKKDDKKVAKKEEKDKTKPLKPTIKKR